MDQQAKAFPKQPTAEGDKKWGDGTPSSITDINAAAENVKGSTANWVNSIATAPSAFDQAFGTLPAKASEAGTNFSSTAMSSIHGGAGDAGAVFGNTAVSIIRAGVSSLNISVNANVTGSKNATADKGGSTPD